MLNVYYRCKFHLKHRISDFIKSNFSLLTWLFCDAYDCVNLLACTENELCWYCLSRPQYIPNKNWLSSFQKSSVPLRRQRFALQLVEVHVQECVKLKIVSTQKRVFSFLAHLHLFCCSYQRVWPLNSNHLHVYFCCFTDIAHRWSQVINTRLKL